MLETPNHTEIYVRVCCSCESEAQNAAQNRASKYVARQNDLQTLWFRLSRDGFTAAMRVNFPGITALLTLATCAVSFPDPCCVDQSGKHFGSSECVCLENDAATETFYLEAGSSMHFHWSLKDLDLVNQPDELRPWLSIATSACWGQFATHVSGLAIDFPSGVDAWYSSNGTQGYSLLRFELAHSSYLISVMSIRSGNFSLVSSTSAGLVPIPLNTGRIDVQQTSETSIRVQFRPSVSTSRVTYLVFYQQFESSERFLSSGVKDQMLCTSTDMASSAGPCTPERAIMHTACGLKRNAILSSVIDTPLQGQISAASATVIAHALTRGDQPVVADRDTRVLVDETLSVSIGNLPLGVPIFVNVLAKGERFDRAYEGHLVRLSFDRVVSLLGPRPTLYIAGAACAIVLALLSVTAWTRSEVQRTVFVQFYGRSRTIRN